MAIITILETRFRHICIIVYNTNNMDNNKIIKRKYKKQKSIINIKKALLISIPIIVLSSTYFIFDNLTFYLINIVLIPILYLIMIIWAISDFQIKSIIYKIILMIFEPLNYIGDVIRAVLKEFNPKEKDEQIGEKKEKKC